MIKRIFVLLFMLILFSNSSAQAGSIKPPLKWTYNSFHLWNPVEQQTPCLPDGTHCGDSNPDKSVWVTNPTSTCAWDADDRLSATFYIFKPSYLGPGDSVSGTWCMVADTTVHLNSLYVSSPYLAGNLTVGNLSVDIKGGQRACIAGPEYNSLDGLPLIPNSNGGVGNRIDITFTVTNPTTKRVKLGYALANQDFAGFLPVSSCDNWPYYTYGKEVSYNPSLWSWVEQVD